MRATNTTESDWNIESVDVDHVGEEARKNVSFGNMSVVVDLMYSTVFSQGSGGDYTETRLLVNKTLVLKDEDLDAVVEERNRVCVTVQPRPFGTRHSTTRVSSPHFISKRASLL